MNFTQEEALLDQCYDECWEDFRKENGLTDDQLYAMEQNSKLGYLPVIADAAVKKFWEITS
jgi:hypothetical protein|tara:strand:- start:1236 stop:1418 length:183 start_codon:yes stop_codon:yes gene_type:complete